MPQTHPGRWQTGTVLAGWPAGTESWSKFASFRMFTNVNIETTPLKSFRKMPDRIWPRRMVGPVKTISNFARPCKTHASYASWVETKRPQIPRRSASSSLGQATHSNPSNHRMFRKKATGLTLAPMETTWFNRPLRVSISLHQSWTLPGTQGQRRCHVACPQDEGAQYFHSPLPSLG